MEKYLKPAVLTFLFFVSTLIGVLLSILLLCLFDFERVRSALDSESGKDSLEIFSEYTFLIQLLGGIVVCLFVWSMKMGDIRKAYDFKSVDWKNAWKVIAGALLYLFCVSGSANLLGADSEALDTTHDLSLTFVGAFTLAFFSPVVIEFVFREANIRHMLENGASYMQALLYSSFLYSLQSITSPLSFIRTFLFSLVYSAIYLKTRNVVLCSIIQVIVNTIAVTLLLCSDYSDTSSTKWDLLLLIVLSAYPCYRLLRSFFKDEPVIPSVFWYKTKRLMVKIK